MNRLIRYDLSKLAKENLPDHTIRVGEGFNNRNIVVGLRNRYGVDKFNDGCFGYDIVEHKPITEVYSCTTDPGKAPRLNQGKVPTN